MAFNEVSLPVSLYATIEFDLQHELFIVDPDLVAVPFARRTYVAPLMPVTIRTYTQGEINVVAIYRPERMSRSIIILLLDWSEAPRGRAVMGYLSYGPMQGALSFSDYRMSLARGHLPELFGPDSLLLLGMRFTGLHRPIRFRTFFHGEINGDLSRDEFSVRQTDVNFSSIRAEHCQSTRPNRRRHVISRSNTYMAPVTTQVTGSSTVTTVTTAASTQVSNVSTDTVSTFAQVISSIVEPTVTQPSTGVEPTIVRVSPGATVQVEVPEPIPSTSTDLIQVAGNVSLTHTTDPSEVPRRWARGMRMQHGNISDSELSVLWYRHQYGQLPVPQIGATQVRAAVPLRRVARPFFTHYDLIGMGSTQPIFDEGFALPNQPDLLSGNYVWVDIYGNLGWRNRGNFHGRPIYGLSRAELTQVADESDSDTEVSGPFDCPQLTSSLVNRNATMDEQLRQMHLVGPQVATESLNVVESPIVESQVVIESQDDTEIQVVTDTQVTGEPLAGIVNEVTCDICDMALDSAADLNIHRRENHELQA